MSNDSNADSGAPMPSESWEVLCQHVMQTALDGALDARKEGNTVQLMAYFDVYENGRRMANLLGLKFNSDIEGIGEPFNLIDPAWRQDQ